MTGKLTIILIDAECQNSDFVKELWQTWFVLDPTVRAAIWNIDKKRFELLGAEDYRKCLLCAPPEHIVFGSEQAPHDRFLNEAVAWIVIPELFQSALMIEQLVEVDLILEARRLGWRSSFIFHGANLLWSEEAIIRAACERHMQALLLADLILPTSRLAENQITGFFVNDQKADFLPDIIKIAHPVDVTCSDAKWFDFVREIRGVLARAADLSLQLVQIYVLEDTSVNSLKDKRFAANLEQAFALRGVHVDPVKWDPSEKRLSGLCNATTATSLDEDIRRLTQLGINNQRWLMIPYHLPDQALIEVTSQARKLGLRVAAIFEKANSANHAESCEQTSTGPAALATLDKVFASSDDCRRNLDRMMLGWRGRVTCAEDRIRTIYQPTEIMGRPRATASRHATESMVHIRAWAKKDVQRQILDSLVDAENYVSKRFEVSILEYNEEKFSSLPLLADQPQKHFTGASTIDVAETDLALADVVIYWDTPNEREAAIKECLWRGIPCLVHEAKIIQDLHRPGVLFVNMHHGEDLRRAIQQISRCQFRHALIDEALAQPAVTWDAYASEISRELATDRLIDSIRKSSSGVRKRFVESLIAKKRPKLSICISTYKRADWLAVNLRNLYHQLDVEDDGRIEILVVDNTSPDETPEIVRPYIGRSNFSYRRNPVNVGMLGNLMVTSQIARGEYVWILGDDDLTRPGSISKVLAILDNHQDLGLIYMNYGYTFEHDAKKVIDLPDFHARYNILQPEGDDQLGTVSQIAARSENFYTAIYCIIFKRDHAMRAYGQDTSGRIFSTMLSCIPTAYYILHYMAEQPAYWVGSHALIMNSNVSWAEYSPLFELEHFPRAWDLAERHGTSADQVDQRREDRLPHTINAWLTIFLNDKAGNGAYISGERILMRIKHLQKLDTHIPAMYDAYEKAHKLGIVAAALKPHLLFAAFENIGGMATE